MADIKGNASSPRTLSPSTIFIYEYFSGGGRFTRPTDFMDVDSMLSEGVAMSHALTQDLAAAGYRVVRTIDHRVPEELLIKKSQHDVIVLVDSLSTLNQTLIRLAAECQSIIVIAPESDGILVKICRSFRRAGGHLIQSSDDFLVLASDKNRTCEWLRAKGLPTPDGFAAYSSSDSPLAFPAVVKPSDGAGSEGIHFAQSLEDWERIPWGQRPWRVESLLPGMAASIAMLCGPTRCVPLAPCLQYIDVRNRFSYHGGCVLTSGPLAERTRRIAARMEPLLLESGATGYIGIDVVLGPAFDGSLDAVIEINPRLTTSFVGLQVASQTNLAKAMLDIALGHDVAHHVQFSECFVEFSPNGTVNVLETERIGVR